VRRQQELVFGSTILAYFFQAIGNAGKKNILFALVFVFLYGKYFSSTGNATFSIFLLLDSWHAVGQASASVISKRAAHTGILHDRVNQGRTFYVRL
jgi:hypothetical protein